MSEVTFKLTIPWGLFGPGGSWTPNQDIKDYVPVSSQYAQNVKNGYIKENK